MSKPDSGEPPTQSMAAALPTISLQKPTGSTPPLTPPPSPLPPIPQPAHSPGFGGARYGGPVGVPPAPAGGGGSRKTIAMVVGGLAVLAIAGTVVGIVLSQKSDHGSSFSAGSGTGLGTATTGDGTGLDGGGDTTSTEPTPTVRPEPAKIMVGLVDITAVKSNSAARKIAKSFDWYFSNINAGDYVGAADALLSHSAPHDPTTFDSQIVIRRIYYRGGQLVATTTFRSHQARRYAPDGYSRCVDWRLTWPIIQRHAYGLPVLLGKPLHSNQPYQSCDF